MKQVRPEAYDAATDGGAGTTYAYDSRGNRIRVTNALGEMVQELSYGLDGKIKNIRRLGDGNWNGSAGDSSEYSGTAVQNIKADESSLSGQRTIQQYEYNARGQITGIVDGNQNPISYDVDGWGRITGVGFADGVKESYEYTPAGQVSKATDGNGNSVQYHYNSLGKVSERTDQLGYTETFQYDEEGNLSLHIDRDGRQLQRACNVFGKPVYEKATDAESVCIFILMRKACLSKDFLCKNPFEK